MNTIYSLEGKTALITGGGSGLGLGMAQCLAKAGAKVVLVGRRAKVLEEALASIEGQAFAVAHDVTQLDAAAELVAKAEAVAGSPMDILVNNAGIHCKKTIVETTPDDFNAVLQTHVLAAHALSAAVLPGMLERGQGNILFTASMASYLGIPLVVAYSAAKSAYVGMVRSMSAEVAGQGVRVNGIAPGWIKSDMLDQALAGDEARKNKILSRTPMGSFGDPEDIGWAAAFLCSDAAKFVSGVILPVDGGAHAGF